MTYEEFLDFESWSKDDDYILIRQENMDVGGGKISIDDIDKINNYDNIDKVMISGLRQDTFEYFIEKYANKIKYIYFYKNKMIEDFSSLSKLTEVKAIRFFHNQRVTKLWDMSNNNNLEALVLSDFSRLHSLEGVQLAPSLKYLSFGDAVWYTSTLTDLMPLIDTQLVSFRFSGKTIENNNISIYKQMSKLKYLDFPTNMYTTEEIAEVVATCPYLHGYALVPYIKFNRSGDEKDILICGKRKPFLDSQKDAAKIEIYKNKFFELVEQYRHVL